MPLLLLLLPLLLLLLPVAEVQAATAGRHNDHFDYFILSREWPFSFCDVEKCKHTDKLHPAFNIHGLWPQQNDGGKPMFCHAKFNKTELQPLQEELRKNWLDLFDPSGSPLKFWETEYKKHGSCAATDHRYNSTFLYFKAALALHEKAPLLPMLAKEGIRPGGDRYNVSSIRSAIRKHFGHEPSVRCAAQNKELLYELRVCFAKNLSPMDCDTDNATVAESPLLKFVPSPRRLLSPLLTRLMQSATSFMSQTPLAGVVRLLGDTVECSNDASVRLPSTSDSQEQR